MNGPSSLAPARPEPAGDVPRRRFFARVLGWLGVGALMPRAGRAATAPGTVQADIPFIGELRMVAFGIVPFGWMRCDGQLLSVNDYPDLHNLLGTTFGGDGVIDFALPNLNGRAPIHSGFAPGGSNFVLGQQGGAEVVTLVTSEMPAHAHTMRADSGVGVSDAPAGGYPARNAAGLPVYKDDTSALLGDSMIATAGQNQAHDNMQPFLAVSFIIAVQGVYPVQN